MPFEKPSAGGSVFECEDGRYLVKVDSLEDTESADYGPGIKWILNVATMDRQMLLDDRGFDATLWQFSSAKLTPRAKGRKWTEAFLARELDEATDDGEAVMAELVGKWAIALLAHNEGGRMYIVSLAPITKAGAKAGTGMAPKVAGGTAGSSRPGPASSPDEPPDSTLDLDDIPDVA